MAFRAALHRLPVRPKLSLHSPAPSAARRIPLPALPHHSPLVSGHRVWRIHSEASSVSTAKLEDDRSSDTWKIKMLYDGECPLCMREVNMLKERNRRYGAIKFVDISSKDYSPMENEGLDYSTVMGRIHAILSDGTVLKDVDAFRGLYEEVGLGWIYFITKYEPMATVANAIYSIWAKYRLQVTGRPPLEDILESRKRKADEECSDKVCKM